MQWRVGIRTSEGSVTGYGKTFEDATESLRRQIKFMIGRGSGKEESHEAERRQDETANLGSEGA